MIPVDPHPLADLAFVEATWSTPLGQLAPLSPDLLTAQTDLPPWSDEVKGAVRDLLRHGGFKPNGRNKPCNEYMQSAVAKDRFPWINTAVDACNMAVFHGGLPISTVDLDRLEGPLRVGLAEAGSSYVFNQSGQELKTGGLLCLFDAAGPCATSVKDSQRAKTDADSTHTLSIIWGTSALPGRTAAVAGWYRQLISGLGAEV